MHTIQFQIDFCVKCRTVTGDVIKFTVPTSVQPSYILLKFFGDLRNLLRSYSGECLGSSSDEERSELRYAI